MGTVAIPDYDAESTVFREHVEVVLPPTYLLVRRPDPPLRGFYVWKFSFAGNPGVSFVFRADSALSASDDRTVVRASALYECRSSEQWALDCKTPVRATARTGSGGVVIDIKEPSVVARIRAAQATVLQRRLIEPGGRFRVDETGIKYR